MFRKSVTLIALVLVAAACSATNVGSSSEETSLVFDPGWPPQRTDFELIPAPVNAEIAVGQNRVLFNVLDRQNKSVASADRPLELSFFHLASSRDQPLVASAASFMETAPGRPGLYRATVDFDRAGDWGVEATVTESDGSERMGRFVFTVRESSSTPAFGAQAPASDTPTGNTAQEIAAITTDDDPDPDFYRQDIAGALAAHEAFVLIFATPAFCQSLTCGPTLDVVKSVAPEFNDRMTFIHVEPYELEMVDGSLRPVLSPDNLPISVPATVEWGLPTEPYIFVVDAQGKVAAKFEGIAAPDELRSAIELALNPAL